MLTTAARQLRILIVDDDRLVREVFANCLGWLGHEVEAAASGPEGLSMAVARTYDLVLTDLRMPGLTGIEVAERLRQSRPGLPIIVTSGSLGPYDERRLGELGLRFLPKPVELDRLEAAVQETANTPG